MSSSLAPQLAQNVSLNASLLSTSRRKPTESYLFPASQAATHDLESIHFLASNAFLQLKSVQPSCRKYEASLFSDAVKNVDRTLLSKGRGEELDGNLRGFLRLLGPWLMEGMVGKILEWLVRRFRCVI
jgi:U3 small nucleolar RNA-associated protein 10